MSHRKSNEHTWYRRVATSEPFKHVLLQRIRAGGFPHLSVHTCSRRLSNTFYSCINILLFFTCRGSIFSYSCAIHLSACCSWGSVDAFMHQAQQEFSGAMNFGWQMIAFTSGLSPDKVRISVHPVGWWWLIIDQSVYRRNFWLRQPHWPNMLLQTLLESPPHNMIIWL